MTQIKIQCKVKRMRIDEAVARRMTSQEERAYLELMNIWINQRD